MWRLMWLRKEFKKVKNTVMDLYQKNIPTLTLRFPESIQQDWNKRFKIIEVKNFSSNNRLNQLRLLNQKSFIMKINMMKSKNKYLQPTNKRQW